MRSSVTYTHTVTYTTNISDFEVRLIIKIHFNWMLQTTYALEFVCKRSKSYYRMKYAQSQMQNSGKTLNRKICFQFFSSESWCGYFTALSNFIRDLVAIQTRQIDSFSWISHSDFVRFVSYTGSKLLLLCIRNFSIESIFSSVFFVLINSKIW